MEKCRGGLVNKISQSNVSIDVESALLVTLITMLADLTSLSQKVFDPSRGQDEYLKLLTFYHKSEVQKREKEKKKIIFGENSAVSKYVKNINVTREGSEASDFDRTARNPSFLWTYCPKLHVYNSNWL